jgi:hypothetical protein
MWMNWENNRLEWYRALRRGGWSHFRALAVVSWTATDAEHCALVEATMLAQSVAYNLPSADGSFSS